MKRFRLTLRVRLTLVYSGLFLASGALLLTVSVGIAATLPISARFTGVSDTTSGSGALPDTYSELLDGARSQALAGLAQIGAITLVVTTILAAWAGWIIAGRMLRPISAITETARRIGTAPESSRGVHERIGLTGPRDELRALADTFDAMLERLDAAFDRQRRFIANASHELRTPLTVNRAILEVSSTRPDASDDLKELSTALLEVNERHERLIEGLLLLARADDAPIDRRFVDLADLVDHLAAEFHPDAVEVRVDTSEAPTLGDPVLLEQVVRNLLENAARHNLPQDGWIGVSTGTGVDGDAWLVVENSGRKIAADDLDELVTPFRRFDGERMAGARGVGLGLSIVRSITDAHDGILALRARPDGGLAVTVTLPGARYDVDDEQ